MTLWFQNPSEVSDEELNDDLLQSDDEDLNMRYARETSLFKLLVFCVVKRTN